MPMTDKPMALGPDGVWRPAELEAQINDIMLSAFTSPAGQQALQYLKNITLLRVTDRGVSSEDLHAAEGARRLVAIISTRIENGRRERQHRSAAASPGTGTGTGTE